MSKLKPCPFCNGEMKLLGSNFPGTRWHFECVKCKVDIKIDRKTRASAIKAYNRRAK